MTIKELRKVIGNGAVRSLRLQKSVLKIWRRTSPHNWWVENKKGEMLWHSSPGERRPSLDMFDLVEHSSNCIWTGSPEIVGRDEGAPEESIYRLKKEYRA